jgi:uncharacterized protein YegJ (DUF2314 family)
VQGKTTLSQAAFSAIALPSRSPRRCVTGVEPTTIGLRFALAVIAAVLLLPADAETLAQSAKRPGPQFSKAGDARMNAAFATAQRTLAGFVDALDGRVEGAQAFSVKVSFTDSGQTEYFWINHLSRKGILFSGTINNRPEIIHTVQFGQQVSFPTSRIRDWGYYLDGKLQGNFTTCVLLAHEDPAQARELKDQIGLTCGDSS